MHRTNAQTLRVNGPFKGLLTDTPSDLQDDGKTQYLTVAENVRAEDSGLAPAPGYERIHTDRPLDGEATLIHQPNLTSSDVEVQDQPVVGTVGSLYAMRKRSRPLVCPVDCTLRFAAVADSGSTGENAAAVAALVRGWNPDLVVCAGDLVYSSGGTAEDDDKYETQVAKHWAWALGGYSGPYGTGPAVNAFFPATGNHDYTDGPLSAFLAFFSLPTGERTYTVKRGPVQFFFLDSYGHGPVSTGPGGAAIDGTGADPGEGQADLSSLGPQAVWLQEQLAESDCPWRVVVWHHPPKTSEALYTPGYAVMDWPLADWGADLLITGHAHVYERLAGPGGIPHIIVGTGGHSLRGFGTPLPESQQRIDGVYGALRVDVSSTTMQIKFISAAGAEMDSIVLTSARPLSVCYRGDLASQPTALTVSPASASAPRLVPFPFTATAQFTDGSSREVTLASAWESSNAAVATVGSDGRAEGQRAGTASITATYQGLSAGASFTVLANCADTAHDIALVLDRSGSMRYAVPPAGVRMDRLKTAVDLFLTALKRGDEVTTLSFADDLTVHHGLSPDTSLARSAVAGLSPAGGTGIAAAVTAARTQLSLSTRRLARKMIVLFTDGVATHAPGCAANNLACAMAAATAEIDAAKAAGITVVVVGLGLGRYAAQYESTVEGWPTCPDLYYSVAEADGLLPVFVRLRNDVCIGLCSSGDGVGGGLL